MANGPFPPPDILYELGPCLAVNKPSGLLTQAPPHIDSLEVRIKDFLRHRDQKPGRVYLGVPHRLDRPVSGAMVFAKHARAARRLSEQFQGRLVQKHYWALLEGRLESESGQWYDYIRKIPNEARGELVDQHHPDAKAAILNVEIIQHLDHCTWVRLRPETGRTHQIRVQAAARHHPVLGDSLYGATQSFGPAREDIRDRAIALHARRLIFHHPMTREAVNIEAPLPQYWPSLDLDLDTV